MDVNNKKLRQTFLQDASKANKYEVLQNFRNFADKITLFKDSRKPHYNKNTLQQTTPNIPSNKEHKKYKKRQYLDQNFDFSRFRSLPK